MSQQVEQLIDRVDLDELIRTVDSLCASRSWSEILRTRDLCRSATRSGRQVWPIATLCEYRLALHAPPEWACRVVNDESSRFSIGPITEVLAQHHTWFDVADHLDEGPHREIVAHERVVRGEMLDSLDLTAMVLDLPFRLQEWEPDYPLAVYSDEGVFAPAPSDQWHHDWQEISCTASSVVVVDDAPTESALRSLVDPWTSASKGRARCLVVEGDLPRLLRCLEQDVLPAAQLTSHQAMQWLAWCGASGGSHGRRRGSAAGRFNTWWLIAALGGVSEEWDELRLADQLSDELGSIVDRVQWYRVDLGERHSFDLSLVAVDDEEGLTIGLFAHDDPG